MPFLRLLFFFADIAISAISLAAISLADAAYLPIFLSISPRQL